MASGSKSTYRGLGSIDFQATARSVLIVGRVKAFKKEATKSIRNIIYCKLMSAPLKDYAQFGWNNANNENFYFDGLDIANTRGFPAYWISHKSKKQMEISAAVQCLQKALCQVKIR